MDPRNMKLTRREALFGAAAMTVSMASLAACGSSSDSSGSSGGGSGGASSSGSLVIWADDKRVPAMKLAGEQFKKENGVDVSVQAISKDLQTQFVTASQAGKGPDLVLGAHDWIGNLVQNGTIDPITLTDDVKSGFNELAIKGVTFNGQIYGIPFAVENIVLFRNTDLAPDAPETFEAMVATGNQLKSGGKVSEVVVLPIGQNGDPYHMYPLYKSAGGYLFGTESNGDYNPKDLGLSQATAATAMAKIATYGEKGQNVLKRSVSGDNLLSFFTGKKTAFMISGPWQIADIKKSGVPYDISPIPGFAGGDKATPFVGVQAMYIASKGKNKAVAQEFATNFFATAAVSEALYETDPRPPALTEAFDALKAKDPDIEKVYSAGEGGDILPAIPAMAAVWDPWGKAEAAIIGGADPSSTISAAAKAIASQIK